MSIYHEFQFKPSRLNYIVHALSFIALEIVFYQVLTPMTWLIIFILHLICSVWFIYTQRRAIYLGYLDEDEWTIITQQLTQKPISQRVRIVNIIHHLAYMVIYFHPDHKLNPIVIWQDQLPTVEWKGLTTRSKFHYFKGK